MTRKSRRIGVFRTRRVYRTEEKSASQGLFVARVESFVTECNEEVRP